MTREATPVLADLAKPDRDFVSALAAQTESSADECLSKLLEQPFSIDDDLEGSRIIGGRFERLHIDCTIGEIRSLDLSTLDALEELSLDGLELPAFDARANTRLVKLWIMSCDELSELRLGELPALEVLQVPGNKLKALDLAALPKLRALACGENQLTRLDLSRSGALQHLSCEHNQLEDLSVENLPQLRHLNCAAVGLRSLDLRALPALSTLIAGENRLKRLDLSQSRELTTLECEQNELTKLDLRGLTKLVTIKCASNRLTSLQLAGCSQLLTLDASQNALASLDLTGLERLTTLSVADNELSALDLASGLGLQSLDISGTVIRSLDITRSWRLLALKLPTGKGARAVKIEATPAQREVIPSLRKRFRLGTGLLGGPASAELHERARAHDWDDGLLPLIKIARHKRCDLGTALLIYWRGKPYYYAQYRGRDDITAEHELEHFDLLTEIEERVQGGKYKLRQIHFDPSNELGIDWTAITYPELPKVRALPPPMFEPSMTGPGPRARGPAPVGMLN